MNYKRTVFCCFFGYMCQAVICNFAPLLFLTFSSQYGIPISEITVLVTANFGFQLLTDLVAPKYVDKLGYRRSLVLAHILCASGLVLLTLLPEMLGGFIGLLLATVVYAIGGGLLEVLVSPVLESSPLENKAGAMSLLHSFYCWGSVATVLISTAFFALFGTDNWKILSLFFAAFPILNAILFSKTPISNPPPAEKDGVSVYSSLLGNKAFIVFLLMMLCAGAAEMAVQQWSSAFAETALGVDKTTGDLLGMCGFSLAMALSRTIYGRFSKKIPLRPALVSCGVLCVLCYLMISLSDNPVIGFAGCILCGFTVGIFWPGSFSLAVGSMPRASTAMFALLSLAGDVGCTVGPTLAGLVGAAFGGSLRTGILSAVFFPSLLLICALFLGMKKRGIDKGEAVTENDGK